MKVGDLIRLHQQQPRIVVRLQLRKSAFGIWLIWQPNFKGQLYPLIYASNIMIQIIRMSTPSNIGQELILHQIHSEVYRVEKKDALTHALAIGFSHSPGNTTDSKYTSKEHPNFAGITQKIQFFRPVYVFSLKNNKSKNQKVVFWQQTLQEHEYFCMVQDRIKLDTDYHVQSKLIDATDSLSGKQAVYVNRSAGYLINKKGCKDLAFYFIDVIKEVSFLQGQFKTECRDFEDWPSRKHDLVFKEKSFRTQSYLYAANSASHPIHSDLKTALAVGLPRPILPSKAIFAMMMRIIVQNALGNDQKRLKQSQMKLLGLAFPGDEFQIRVWKQESRFYLQMEVIERKMKVVRGKVGVRHSPKI